MAQDWLLVVVYGFFVYLLFKGDDIIKFFSKQTDHGDRARDFFAFILLALIFSFIIVSRDPIIITIAIVFLLMRVLTRGPKKPIAFEDARDSKWWPQYP